MHNDRDMIKYGIDSFHFLMIKPQQKTQRYTRAEFADVIEKYCGHEKAKAVITVLRKKPGAILEITNR